MSHDAIRKHESGAKKRKQALQKKERQEEIINKTPKLSSFFRSVHCKEDDQHHQQEPGTSGPSTDTCFPAPCETDANLTAAINTISEEACEHDEMTSTDASDKNDPDSESVGLPSSTSPSNDVACWGSVTGDLQSYWVEKGVKAPLQCQHKDASFAASERTYKTNKRRLSKALFDRSLRNGEHVPREWLVYSPSTGNVFCFHCLLFGESPSSFSTTGFSDWKHSVARVQEHEVSQPHRKAVLLWLARTQARRIDHDLLQQCKEEESYWREVLKRVVEVIKFLSERGLSFRGSDETFGSPHNGNYLGLLELLSQFDPFLAEHMKKYANRGRGSTSYLSNTICEEFIALMGQRIQAEIINQVQRSKYFAMIVDSTPDLAHIDQLTFVVRYVSEQGQVFERFLKFLPIYSHTGDSLFDSVTQILNETSLDIQNCRGQCYDNASNMSGVYKGLRARIQEINPLASWIPCTAHSLNLVGMGSVGCCGEATAFFRFLQSCYTFFSGSPRRWKMLMDGLEANENSHLETLKSLSDTRWASHAQATKALSINYDNIHRILRTLSNDTTQTADTRDEAKSLVKKMDKLETAFFSLLWNQILQRFQATSVALQTVDLDLVKAVSLIQSLKDYVQDLRGNFDEMEITAKRISTTQQYKSDVTRQVTRTRRADESDTPDHILTGSAKFRVEVFYVIIDTLVSMLQKRCDAYRELSSYFGFLSSLKSMSSTDIRAACRKLVNKFSADLQVELEDELIQFVSFNSGTTDLSPRNMMRLLKEQDLSSVFPNVDIALRLYLTLPVSNASGERSFSKLGLIKNRLRTTMTEGRLNCLTIMSTEYDLLRQIDFNALIKDFASQKCRKVRF